MRVAFVLTQDRGGPVDVTVRLAADLAATGDVQVRVLGPRPVRDPELLDGLLEVVEVPHKGSVGAARAVRAALRAWRPDVVHAQDRRSGLVAVGLERARGGPGAVVQTYHGMPGDVGVPWIRGDAGAPAPARYTRTVLAADALVARAVTTTVVPSPFMGTFLQRRLRVPAHKVAHIDNAVTLPPSSPPTGPVRRLLFVGLLAEHKGVADLLSALALPGTLPEGAVLTVAGDGPDRSAFEQQAARLGLGDRVRFLGYRTDVPALLAEADALVLPSRMEQQPLVVAEAMAAGKPVLATRVGGVADMLEVPGARTWLAEPADVQGLAGALVDLLSEPDPGRTGELLAAAARRRFAPQVCARGHRALYDRLLG